MSTICPGDRVRVHYTTRSLEGSVIETSANREPLEFRADGPEVVSGLSRAVVGLKIGDRRTITITPEQGFGHHSAELIQSTSRSSLPEDLQAGDQLTATVDNADLDVWVQRVTGQEAVLDANHPLAGETLVIEIEIVGLGHKTTA